MGWGQCLLVERLSAAGKFLPVAVAVPEDYLAVYISECGAVALLKVVRQLVAGGKEPMVTTAPCLRARHVIRGIVPALPIAVEGNHAVCRGVQQGASARKYDRTLTSGRQAGWQGGEADRAGKQAGGQSNLAHHSTRRSVAVLLPLQLALPGTHAHGCGPAGCAASEIGSACKGAGATAWDTHKSAARV